MLKRISHVRRPMLFGVTLSATLLAILSAQQPQNVPVKTDSPQFKESIEKIKKTGGERWAPAVNFFCLMPHANTLDDPLIEPTKIFDNVYVIGSTGTVAYAITTSDGIMLIDALPPQQTESVLLPGLKKLGLDPANIKMAVISHGHADHFGGSIYLQEHYGTHVALTAADWDFMQPRPGAGKGKAANSIPNRDVIAVEGQPITLGDEKVYPVYTPGHTPGSLGLIFNVKDGGKTHMAGMYGGTLLLPDRPDETAIKQYLASAEHFKAETKKMKVDVELQNHPLMDDVNDRLAKVRERKPGGPNPFVVGEKEYAKFLDILTDCLKTRFANRAGS